MTDRETLRALADWPMLLADWRVSDADATQVMDGVGRLLASAEGVDEAAWIAAANPAAVLALLDDLDRAEAEIKRLREGAHPVKRDEFSRARREEIIEALSWMEGSEGRWGYDKARDVLHAHEVEWCGRTDTRPEGDDQ